LKKVLSLFLCIILFLSVGVNVSAKSPLGISNLRVVYSKTKLTTLKWKPLKNAKYQVFRSTSENGKYKLVSSVKKAKFKDRKIEIGKTYYYKVRAYRKVGKKTYYGSYSSVKYAKAK